MPCCPASNEVNCMSAPDDTGEILDKASRLVSNDRLSDAREYLVEMMLQRPSHHLGKRLSTIFKQGGELNHHRYCRRPHYNIPPEVLRNMPGTNHDWDVYENGFQHDSIETNPVDAGASARLEFRELSIDGAGEIVWKDDVTDFRFPASYVYTLDGGRGYCFENSSAVFSKENELLQDVSTGPSNAIAASRSMRPAEQLDGSAAFLCSKFVNTAYFHWMAEYFPRLGMLSLAGVLDDVDHLVLPRDGNARFIRQCLAAIGIDAGKVVSSGGHCHYRADRLLVPSQMNAAYGVKWSREFLLGALGPRTRGERKNLYISRRQSFKRRIRNEAELMACLKKNGFVFLELEGMTVQEQAAAFRGANIVVAPHGAGLTNMLFADENATLIEMFNPAYINNCFQRMVSQTGGRYLRVVGESLLDDDRIANEQDMQIDARLLDSALQQAIDGH